MYNLIFILVAFLFGSAIKSEDVFEAMSKAYQNSPQLKAYRAKLKAVDEKVSMILSEKRPTLSLSGSLGTDRTTTVNNSNLETTQNNLPKAINLELSQNLFDSGKIRSKLNKAENLVMAERAALFAEEQKVLMSTAEVYLNLFASKELLKLRKNN